MSETKTPPAPNASGPDRAAGRLHRRRAKQTLASGAVMAALIGGGLAFAISHDGTPSKAANTYDCKDLTYAEAQRILVADRSDPNHLDANHDGRA